MGRRSSLTVRPRGHSGATRSGGHDAAIATRRACGAGVRRLGRGFVRRRRRDQADRGLAVHPAADDGHHGPDPQGGRPARRRTSAAEAGRPSRWRSPRRRRSPRRSRAGRTPWRWRRPAGRGPLRWSVDGPLPEGLTFDPASGQIRGHAPSRDRRARSRWSSASATATTRRAGPRGWSSTSPTSPLTTPSRWKPGLPPIPWRAWLEQGFGFLVLWLVHLVGMNAIASLGARGLADRRDGPGTTPRTISGAVRRRFAAYRAFVRLVTLGATAALAVWLWRQLAEEETRLEVPVIAVAQAAQARPSHRRCRPAIAPRSASSACRSGSSPPPPPSRCRSTGPCAADGQ